METYLAEIANIKEVRKAGFLGLEIADYAESLDREDLANMVIKGGQGFVGAASLKAKSDDLLTLVRVALLSTDKDEFTIDDIENVLLPARSQVLAALAEKVRNFEDETKKIRDRVLALLEEIDEIVAEGLQLTPSEHEVIRQRCQQFPLSITVERPRFAWSPDRKRQARRVYRPGERFK